MSQEVLNQQPNKRKKIIGDVIVACILLLTLAFSYFATNVWLSVHLVKNVSMKPTLLDGDVVFADKLATPRRGDVVIFAYDEDVDYVKRVIATEGDTIYFEKNGDTYSVYIKYKGKELKELLKEPYLEEGVITTYKSAPVFVLGEGELFVMGDNREDSYDSRDFGPIKEDQVKGVVNNFFIAIKGFSTAIYSNGCSLNK